MKRRRAKEEVKSSGVVEEEEEEEDARGWELRLYQARWPGESRRESGWARGVGGREEASYIHIFTC